MIQIHNVKLTERLKDFECMVLLYIYNSSIYFIAMTKICAKIKNQRATHVEWYVCFSHDIPRILNTVRVADDFSRRRRVSERSCVHF